MYCRPFLRWRGHNNHFLGAFFYPRLVVSDSYHPNWNEDELGGQTTHVLSSIEGVPVSSGRDVFTQLRQKQINNTVSLTLERIPALSGDAQSTLSVSLGTFARSDMVVFFWLPYSIGIIYLILGLVVYRLRGSERVGVVFVIFCAFISILTGGLFDQFTFHFFTPVWAFVFPLTGVALLYLSFVFPVETRVFRRRPWFGAVPYVPALILGAANLYSLYFAAGPQLFLQLWLWNFGYIGLSVAVFLILMLDARLSTLSVPVRQQVTVLFWGSIISFGPGGIWTLASMMGLTVPFSWPLFFVVFASLVIFPTSIIYASLRYRLLDLELVFSRGITYTLLVILVTVAYFLVVSLLSALLHDTLLFRNPFVLAVFILILIVFFEPVRRRIQSIVDRHFLLEPFDSRQLLQNFGRALISAPLDAGHILKMVLKPG